MKDRTVFYEEGPRAVLLLHAYTSTPVDFFSFANELKRNNYTVYAPTFTGHGTDNPDNFLNNGMKTYVEDGKQALDFLKEKGYKEIAVFGLSLGGIVATSLIVEDESQFIAGGTFCSPVMNITEDHNIDQNFERLYRQMKSEAGHNDEEVEELWKEARQELDEELKSMELRIDDMLPEYKEINLPMFVAQGGADTMISPKHGPAFRDELEKADVSYYFYEDAPHYITVGRSGRQVLDDFIPFLEQLPWTEENN